MVDRADQPAGVVHKADLPAVWSIKLTRRQRMNGWSHNNFRVDIQTKTTQQGGRELILMLFFIKRLAIKTYEKNTEFNAHFKNIFLGENQNNSPSRRFHRCFPLTMPG